MLRGLLWRHFEVTIWALQTLVLHSIAWWVVRMDSFAHRTIALLAESHAFNLKLRRLCRLHREWWISSLSKHAMRGIHRAWSYSTNWDSRWSTSCMSHHFKASEVVWIVVLLVIFSLPYSIVTFSMHHRLGIIHLRWTSFLLKVVRIMPTMSKKLFFPLFSLLLERFGLRLIYLSSSEIAIVRPSNRWGFCLSVVWHLTKLPNILRIVIEFRRSWRQISVWKDLLLTCLASDAARLRHLVCREQWGLAAVLERVIKADNILLW